MTLDYISLLVIFSVAALCPLIAYVVPKKAIPETVLLLFAGAVLGPNMLGIMQIDSSISLLSDLGLGFLFLLAGYEIEPAFLRGKRGSRSFRTWLFSFAAALAFIGLLFWEDHGAEGVFAIAIALTTTALGALIPILKERNLAGTPMGILVLSFGAWGELGPILAISVLLSTRNPWQTGLVLFLLFLLCVIVVTQARRIRRERLPIYRIWQEKSEATSQSFVRLTVLLLILLLAVSSILDLDIVLGAFAAGFVLRQIAPKDNGVLEGKLDSLGYGFFIPVFFVVSGAKIDMSAVLESPLRLLCFVIALIVIRAVPVFVTLLKSGLLDKGARLEALAVSSYCATALPLIVAIASITVETNVLTQAAASTMIAAGAVSMLTMPLFAELATRAAVAKGRRSDETAHSDDAESCLFPEINLGGKDASGYLQEHEDEIAEMLA